MTRIMKLRSHRTHCVTMGLLPVDQPPTPYGLYKVKRLRRKRLVNLLNEAILISTTTHSILKGDDDDSKRSKSTSN